MLVCGCAIQLNIQYLVPPHSSGFMDLVGYGKQVLELFYVWNCCTETPWGCCSQNAVVCCIILLLTFEDDIPSSIIIYQCNCNSRELDLFHREPALNLSRTLLLSQQRRTMRFWPFVGPSVVLQLCCFDSVTDLWIMFQQRTPMKSLDAVARRPTQVWWASNPWHFIIYDATKIRLYLQVL